MCVGELRPSDLQILELWLRYNSLMDLVSLFPSIRSKRRIYLMFSSPDGNDLVSFFVHIYYPSDQCFVVPTHDSTTGWSTGNSCSETDD